MLTLATHTLDTSEHLVSSILLALLIAAVCGLIAYLIVNIAAPAYARVVAVTTFLIVFLLLIL